MKVFVMQFSPSFHYLASLWSLNLQSTLDTRDKVSDPYKIEDKILVLCILIFMFIDEKWNDSFLNQVLANSH